MKRIMIILAVTIIFASGVALAEPEESETPTVEESIEEILGSYDFSSWDKMLDSGVAGVSDIRTLIENYTSGNVSDDPNGIVEMLKTSVLDRIKSSMISLISIFIIALTSGFALTLFPNGGKIYETLSLTTAVLIIGIIAYCFSKTAALAANTIERLSTFSEVSLPVLSVMLTACGASTGAGIVAPLSAFLSGGVVIAVKTVIMPMILITGVLAIIVNLADRIALKSLYGFFKSASKWTLGLLSTVYFGICSIKGLVAGSCDGLSIKTAKYALDKLIPIAGSFVSGTVDTVLVSAQAVKNSAGIAAIVVSASIMLSPLIEILAYMFAFRLTAALTEPLSDPRIPKMLSSCADVLGYVFSAALLVGIMLFLTIGMIISLGNV
ncbi:MAG: stage III sporulation protein AE [Clostridia bacterium]